VDERIGYCGYDCGACAARSDDPALRRKLVDGWRKYFGYQNYTVENVRCDGCRADGRLADSNCKARPCAVERGVESCALCDDFPCDKVRPLFATREGMLVFPFPATSGITQEEYDLCFRQFESLPRLARLLTEAGKLPGWLKDG